MLSRIAESLFWIGRYVERADETARILDVHIHYLLEGPALDATQTAQVLLDTMGVPVTLDAASAPELPLGLEPEHESTAAVPTIDIRGIDAQAIAEILAFDETNPSSIVAALTSARANARGVSEAISSEMWESLNATYNSLAGQVGLGRRVGMDSFFRFVRERTALFAGLTDSTMSKDGAWRFLVLGRSLERVDMLARLLATRVGQHDIDVDWVVLLRCCSAHEAFLRTYRREPDELLAAEFLVLDRLFPRSIFSALASAEACLLELDPSSNRAGTRDEARRLLGLARARLEYRGIDELLADLPTLLRAVQHGCRLASEATASRYFRQSAVIEWSWGGAGPPDPLIDPLDNEATDHPQEVAP
jgi:uncharacterized alpha-E superfamily protein